MQKTPTVFGLLLFALFAWWVAEHILSWSSIYFVQLFAIVGVFLSALAGAALRLIIQAALKQDRAQVAVSAGKLTVSGGLLV